MKPEHAPFPRHRAIGLVAGPVVAAVMLLTDPPSGLSAEGWFIAAVGLWMAIWWMTEALPLAVTALLPLVVMPTLNVRGIDSIAPAYAHPLIFLFLGGFLLARAMSVWHLDRRLALNALSRAGSNPRKVIAALMGVTAFLSMWVSNTATTMVMLPIGLSIAATFQIYSNQQECPIAPPLLLGIAYAATIGGMGTLIGTPPNALFAAFMFESHGVEIGFLHWMLVGVPVVLLLLPITWSVLTRFAFKIGTESSPQVAKVTRDQLNTLPAISRAEYSVATIMIVVAALWIFRPLISSWLPQLPLTDAGIAITGAILLFIIPADFSRGRFLLSWEEAAAIRWDVLILFGGGLALASAMGDSDLAGWLAAQLSQLQTLPLFLLLLAIGVFVVFVGELASNTAMAAVFLPVAAATSVSIGEPVLAFTLPVALFATLGFMLPVATPPNAIVFGSGALEMRHMLRAGVALDIIGIAVVAVWILAIAGWLFGWAG